jgi:DNA integrity scanning protein DisA with diadenylate cyclase activity
MRSSDGFFVIRRFELHLSAGMADFLDLWYHLERKSNLRVSCNGVFGGFDVVEFIIAHFKDIVDILIVSYVVYKLILLVRGTRAIQFLKGILVVVAAWGLSYVFHLNTLQWMVKQMMNTGLIAIIIIFQPELRRALEQLGRGKLFSRSSGGDDQGTNHLINEVIRAVNHMAKRESAR